MKVSGIIIAGGKSSRMGFDKAGIIFKEQRFIDRAIGLLEKFTNDIIISSHKDYQTKYPSQKDKITGTGAIGGLYSCLPKTKYDISIVIPIDMPLLSEAVISFLLKNADTNKDINVIKTDAYLQMLVGLYHKNIVPVLEQQIKEKNYQLKQLTKLIDTHLINADIYSRLFINVNNPDELKKLQETHEQ